MILYDTEHNHSLSGITLSYGNEKENSTIYLDYNYNGVLDYGEPNVTTNREFYFDNLRPGNYLA